MLDPEQKNTMAACVSHNTDPHSPGLLPLSSPVYTYHTFMFLVGIKLWTMDGLHVLPEGAGIGVTLRTARGLTHIGFLQ